MIGRCVAVGLALALLSGCDQPTPPTPAASASVAAPTRPAPSAAASASSGVAVAKSQTWRGSYDAQAYAIEVPKNQGPREWAADDGGTLEGKGTVTFSISPSGAIQGTATGALGEHHVVGEVDGASYRIRFVPKDPGERIFGGFAILTLDGDALKGRLQGSTGDSKTVRDALITVSREGATSAPSPAPSSSG